MVTVGHDSSWLQIIFHIQDQDDDSGYQNYTSGFLENVRIDQWDLVSSSSINQKGLSVVVTYNQVVHV